MSMTRNGIVYDLGKSPYIEKMGEIEFYFSSKNHLDKFNEMLQENRETLAYSLYKRFKMWVTLNVLFDIILYNKVESRGFLIKVEGETFKCLKEIKLNGVNRILKN